jgi:hypothetical protein
MTCAFYARLLQEGKQQLGEKQKLIISAALAMPKPGGFRL